MFFSGEALGAIGDPEVLEILKQYSTDPVVEVTQHPPAHTDPHLGSRNWPQTLCLVARVTTQGCQERAAVRMDTVHCPFGQN